MAFYLNKIVDFFMDFLFREGDSSAPREPPGYGPVLWTPWDQLSVQIIIVSSAYILKDYFACQAQLTCATEWV